MNEHEQIRELAKTNPVIKRVLDMYYYRQCTWLEAMMLAVITLAEDNEKLKTQLIECISTQSRTYIITTSGGGDNGQPS